MRTPPRKVVLPAYAKVNLFLNVLGRRPDGYHDLETIFQTVSLADELTVERLPPADFDRRIDLRLSGPSLQKDVPSDGRNIVWRAAEKFLEGRPDGAACRITLKKRIPSQAGLGGGSADAAAALKAMLALDPGESVLSRRIRRIARALGADVPFFLEGGCALAGGTGEKLTPLAPAPRFWAVVVKPPVGLSTAKVYGWLDEERQKESAAGRRARLTYRQNLHKIRRSILAGRPAREWAGLLVNSFEDVVFKKVPELKNIKTGLTACGALAALLSGSGSAFFGIVGSREEGERIARQINRGKMKAWAVRAV